MTVYALIGEVMLNDGRVFAVCVDQAGVRFTAANDE